MVVMMVPVVVMAMMPFMMPERRSAGAGHEQTAGKSENQQSEERFHGLFRI